MEVPYPRCFRFGLFEFNSEASELRKRGLKVKIGRLPCKVLAFLLEHPGQLRTREELFQRLWPADTCVDLERSLNKAIHTLREALGDSATTPRYVETVAGQGYRFIPLLAQAKPAPISRTSRKIGSVAVLPFMTPSTEPEFLFLASQITSQVINTLSISGIPVLAHSTVRCYQAQDKSPQQIGEDLRVQSVMFGELVRHNSELILNVELIDVADGTQLWGAKMRHDCRQGSDCSEQLSTQIVQHLQCFLSVSKTKVVPFVRRSASFASRGVNHAKIREQA